MTVPTMATKPTAFTTMPVLAQHTQNFLAKADNMACEIIAKHNSTEYSGPVVIRHYHYYHSPFWWYTPIYSPTYIVVPNDRSRRGHYKDDGAAVLFGVVAAVVGGIALYGAGSAISRVEDASNELKETQDFKKELRTYYPFGIDNAYMHGVNGAVKLKERICSRIETSAIWDLTLRVSLFAACAFALVGAITSTPAFMTAWLVASLVIGGAMLLKWGVEVSDARNFRDAQELHALVQNLKA